MWGVNQNYAENFDPIFGRNSFGVPFQPRLFWSNASLNLDYDRYPSFGWVTSEPLVVRSHSAGAIWLASSLSKTSHREIKVTFGDLAARLRYVQWLDASENGSPEFRSYQSTGTVDYVVFELLESGSVTQSKIIHAASDGAANIAAGFAYIDGGFRFVSWASTNSAGYGAGTAVHSIALDGEPDIAAATKTVEGSPSLRIYGAAEHYGPLFDTHTAIPDDLDTVRARAGGPPGSLRQRQNNALVPVGTLPKADCGQMIELTRNQNEGVVFVQSLAAYDYSESMPHLPPTQASNLHDDPDVNERLERLQCDLAFSVPNVGAVSGTAICTNDGSGLNEYRGTTTSGTTTLSVLISLFRTDSASSLANLAVSYSVRVGVKATDPNGSLFFSTNKTLTTSERAALFGGSGSVNLGAPTISAIGPA